MPLKSGRSRATVSKNIKELIGSGKKLNQALAIAQKKRLQSFKKKKLSSKVDTSRRPRTKRVLGKMLKKGSKSKGKSGAC